MMPTATTPPKNNSSPFKRAKLTGIASIMLALLACGNEPGKVSDTQTQATQAPPVHTDKTSATSPVQSALTAGYLSLASQQFKTICSNAEQLQTSIQFFLSNPNKNALEETKKQWISTHSSYAASKLFRILNIKHPVLDRSQIDPVKHSLSIRIDQSPLLPGYLDAVENYPQSGYVFSPLPIDKETLNKEHQFSDTLYVTLGFHAIEFLLWGEQARKMTDYATLTDSKENPELFQARRSQLLSLTTKLLTEDLQTQCQEWRQVGGYYPLQLTALPEEKQNEYIAATMEQLLSDIQINSTQIKNEIEAHSAFANSDKQDLQAQVKVFKSLLESKEWKELSEKLERAKNITQSAEAIVP